MRALCRLKFSRRGEVNYQVSIFHRDIIRLFLACHECHECVWSSFLRLHFEMEKAFEVQPTYKQDLICVRFCHQQKSRRSTKGECI